MAEDIFLNHSFIAQGAAISLTGGELRIVKNESFGLEGTEETIIQLSDGNQSLKKLKITVDKTAKTAAIQELEPAQEEIVERSADQSNDIVLETDVDSSRGIDNMPGIVLETDVDSSIADPNTETQDRSLGAMPGIVLETDVDSSIADPNTETQDRSLGAMPGIVLETDVDSSIADPNTETQDRSLGAMPGIVLETDVDSSIADPNTETQDRSLGAMPGIVLETDVDSSIADPSTDVQERSIEEDTTGIILEISSNENLDAGHQIFSLDEGKRLLIKYDEQEEKLVAKGAALEA